MDEPENRARWAPRLWGVGSRLAPIQNTFMGCNDQGMMSGLCLMPVRSIADQSGTASSDWWGRLHQAL